MPRNATLIENSAGYSYGKMAFFVTEDLYPNRRAEDHQYHCGKQPSQPPIIAPRVVSFDQYMESRMIGKLQLAAMANASPTIKAMF